MEELNILIEELKLHQGGLIGNNTILQRLFVVRKELEKQFSLQGVGSSLPTKEEIALEFSEITKQDNKVGCPKNESEAYKRGFIHGTIFKRTKGKSDM